MTELVIFDCDGVLVDSELIACAADAEALSHIGYPISVDEVALRFTGVPHDAMYASLEKETGRPLPVNFAHQVTEKILAKYRTELQPIDGAAQLLSGLEIPKCVASSSEPAKLALGLIETGLFELVYPHIFSARLVARGKPHPDIFLYAARQMNVEPQHCVVVEDSVAGVTAAVAAGMRTIGFIGGGHITEGYEKKLMDAGTDMIMRHLSELPLLLHSN